MTSKENNVPQEPVYVRVYYKVQNSVVVKLEGEHLAGKTENELIALAGEQIGTRSRPGRYRDEAFSRLEEDGVLSLRPEDSYVTDKNDA